MVKVLCRPESVYVVCGKVRECEVAVEVEGEVRGYLANYLLEKPPVISADCNVTQLINCGQGGLCAPQKETERERERSIMETNKFDSSQVSDTFGFPLKRAHTRAHTQRHSTPGQLSFSTFHACMRKVFAPNEARAA